MKILILSRNYPNPGNSIASIFVQDQAQALAQAGHDVTVIAVIWVSLLEVVKKRKAHLGIFVEQKKGVRSIVFRMPIIPRTWRLSTFYRKIATIWLFNKFYRKIPDVIHCHFVDSAYAALYIKRKHGIPFVITEHNSSFLINRIPAYLDIAAKRLFPLASERIAVSNALADNLARRYRCKFIVIPNIVDTETFCPIISNNGKTREINSYIAVGNLVPGKNYLSLIEAFALAFHNDASVILTIIGDGPERVTILNKIAAMNMQEKIKLTGQLERRQIVRAMQKADAFVHPSLCETFGVSIAEAMSMGLPAISTPSGGPIDIVCDNRVGIICDFKTESIAAALLQCRKMNWDRKYIRQTITSRFSANVIVERLVSVYYEVM